MHCRILVGGLIAAFAFGSTAYAADDGHQHQHGAKGALPACPVMGDDPIDLSIRLATETGPVYFCCPECFDTFKKNPAKYADKVRAQRQSLASLPKVQSTCPVTGKPIDKKVTAVVGGQKVAFCCKGCIAKFKKNPRKYQVALANSYTHQTKCPVMGGPIDPQASLVLADGRSIYFCCGGCDKKLAKKPAKFLPNLESQGVHVAADDLAGAKAGAKAEAGGSHSHRH